MPPVWTAPQTWADGVIYTATDMNRELRDNMMLLKLPKDDAGKVLGFTAAVFTSLVGTNLTGLVSLAGSNTYTTKNHMGAARLVLPVGADLFTGPGALWVEGNYLHWIDEASAEWRFQGTSNGSPAGATVGSFWIENNDVHYIDASGVERIIVGSTTSMHSDSAALGGSLWVEGVYMHWVRQTGTQEYFGHGDSHNDHGHQDTHNDVAGSSSHTDSTPHSDTHTDIGHTDAHQDGHGDSFTPQHADTHTDQHQDVAPVASHTDTTTHNDIHTDVAHTDIHTDNGHGDDHNDGPEAVP